MAKQLLITYENTNTKIKETIIVEFDELIETQVQVLKRLNLINTKTIILFMKEVG